MGVSVSYRTQPSSVDTTRPTKDGSTHALSDPVVIRISQGGFVPSTLTVFSRQKVSWQWEGDENTEGHNVVQVSATDQRYHFPPVPGGFSSGPLSHSDTFDVSLRAPGTYYFTSYGFASYKVGTVHVKDIPPRTVKVSDGSFHPSLVEISEGEAVRWEWDSIPNDVKQMRYCPKHGGLIVEKSNFDLDDTPSYTTTQEFKSSGLHYCFSNNTTEPCVVRVQQSDREINIRFAGDGGGPPVVHASVGDRIWVKNDQPKKNSRKMYIKNEEGIIVVSTKPIDLVSRRHSSLLSHCVTLPGVYQVCCEDECGSILQTCVLVQPRTKEHVINIDSQGFKPELGCIQKGDRVWWMWSGEEDVPGGFTVQQESFVTTSQRPSSEEEDDCCVRSEELCQAISPVGLITAKQDSEGLVTYYLKPTGPWQPQGAAMCSLIVQNTAQEHLVCISDQNFKPQIISVHPGDSVTWLWENTVNSHNIQQASHQRTIIPDGFHGDRPIPSPGAFRHVFTDLGLFYFTSSALPSLCGAVVVTAQPQIHKVEVSLFGVEPDPVIVKAGDCVCWMWCSGELYDIRAIVSPEEIGQVSKDQYIPEPRRCFAKHFSGTGAHHVACTAFTRDEDEPELHASDTFTNTVLVDPLPYSSRVRLSRNGFRPAHVVIAKYQSVLWTWEDAGEEKHNIFHIKEPHHQQARVQGAASFDSGPVTKRSSFFHTFDTAGSYWVMSEGAEQDRICQVEVLEEEKRVIQPRFAEGNEGGIVEKGFTIYLACDDDDVSIFYTTDGTSPHEHVDNRLVYDWNTGIRLDRPGLYLIRCIAHKDGWIPSAVFTSRRIWVLEDEEDGKADIGFREQITNWQWSSSIPFISYGFIFDNVIRVVLEMPKTAELSWIAGFKLYVDGIVQGGWICASCPCIEVSGLCGGRTYHVVLVVFPVNEQFKPQLSNELVITCSEISSLGGPVVSLETCGRVDALVIVWPAFPDTQFQVMVDGAPFGDKITPEPDIDYCRVLFESTDEGHLYTLSVVMYSEGSSERLVSNELQFSLPLPDDLIQHPELSNQDSEVATTSRELILVSEATLLDTNTSVVDKPSSIFSNLTLNGLETIPEDKQLDVISSPPLLERAQGENLLEDDDILATELQPGIRDKDEMKPAEKKRNDSAKPSSPRLEGRPLFDLQEYDELTNHCLSSDADNNRDILDSKRGFENEVPAQDSNSCDEDVIDSKQDVFDKTKLLENKVPKVSCSDDKVTDSKRDVFEMKESFENEAPESSSSAEVSEADQEMYAISEMEQKEKGEERENARVNLDDGSKDESKSLSEKTLEEERNNDGNTAGITISEDIRREDLQTERNAMTNEEKLEELSLKQSKDIKDCMVGNEETCESSAVENFERKSCNSDGDFDDADRDHKMHQDCDKNLKEKQDSGIDQANTLDSADTGINDDGFGKDPNDDMMSANRREWTPFHGSNLEAGFNSLVAKLLIHYNCAGLPDGETQNGPQATDKETTQEAELLDLPYLDNIKAGATRHVQASKLQSEDVANFDKQTKVVNAVVHRQPENKLQNKHFIAIFAESAPPDRMEWIKINETPIIVSEQWQEESLILRQTPKKSSMLKKVILDEHYVVEDDLDESAERDVETDGKPYENKSTEPHDEHDTGSQEPNQDREVELTDGLSQGSVNKGVNGQDSECQDESDHPEVADRQASDLSVESSQDFVNKDVDGQASDLSVESSQDFVNKDMDVQDSDLASGSSEDSDVEEVNGQGALVTDGAEPQGVTQAIPSSQIFLVFKGSHGDKAVFEWECGDFTDFTFLVLGTKFGSSVDSDFSVLFKESCTRDIWPRKTNYRQHCWKTRSRVIEVAGLRQRQPYRVAVVSSSLAMSNVVVLTMPGRPKTPVVHLTAVRDREATVCWKQVPSFGDAQVVGYRITVNGTQHEDLLPHDSVHHTIAHLEKGAEHKIRVVAVTNHSVGDSHPSQELTITCPHPPLSPEIYEVPSSTRGAITIAWQPVPFRPTPMENAAPVTSYAVFVDGGLHGSCPANDVTDIFLDELVYTVGDLEPGREYEVWVCGHVDPQIGEGNQQMCGCYGPPSNTLRVFSACAPAPPLLTVVNMDATGATLAWERPREFGGIKITGYLLRVNGHIYEDILPPNCQRTSITNLLPGQSITVTLTAMAGNTVLPFRRVPEAADSGIDSSSSLSVDHAARSDLGLCSTSPPLVLHLWGFVRVVRDVVLNQASCCSVVVSWVVEEEKEEDEEGGGGGGSQEGEELRPLHVCPEGYRVTWWRSNEEKTDLIGSTETTDCNLQLTCLQPSCRYAVLVEAFSSHPNDPNAVDPLAGFNKTRSEKVWFDMESPPEPPTNFRVASSTSSAITLTWDAPPPSRPPTTAICLKVRERRESADDTRTTNSLMKFKLMPSTTTYTVKNLAARTQYLFSIQSVPGDGCSCAQQPCGEARTLFAWTSGVVGPSRLSVTERTPFSLHLSWQPAITYGDLCIKHYLIHFSEKTRRLSSYGISQLPKDGKRIDVPQSSVLGLKGHISGLEPGLVYRVIVEAVVGIREDMSSGESGESCEEDGERAASSLASSDIDRLAAVSADCLSGPLMARTSAPPGKPTLLLAGITATQIQLAWDPPAALHLDYAVRQTAERHDYRGRIRSIRGYVLDVNGREVTRLAPNKRSYTLKRCKPGMKYTCQLKVTTNSGMVSAKHRKDEISTAISSDDLDTDDESDASVVSRYPEAVSDPLGVIIPRQEHPATISVYYASTCSSGLSQSSKAASLSHSSALDTDDTRSSSAEGSSTNGAVDDDDGCIVVMWNSSAPIRSMSSIKVTWSTEVQETEKEEYLPPSCNSFEIYPVKKRSLYTIMVKFFRLDGTSFLYGPFSCQIPGRPDPPWIWCRGVSEYRILVEWNEPRIYGLAAITGYQVNLNGRQLGGILSPLSRKVTVHCQPSSVYRVRILALTADPTIGNSEPSNLLTICTPGSPEKSLVPKQQIRLRSLWTGNERIAVQWDSVEDEVDRYVVKWSSVLSPQPQEETLPATKTSMVIEECIAGTRHFIAVAAIDSHRKLIAKSTQLIVQTSAPLQKPVLRKRCALPSGLIIEWSQPPSIGDATPDQYEIKVDDVSRDILDKSQLSYELASCHPCRQYSFQVRALSSKEGCDSDWSPALLITCPGARAPMLSRVRSSRIDCIHVGWEMPELCGGAVVECYKVYYLEVDSRVEINAGGVIDSPHVITHGPLNGASTEDVLYDVTSAYWVVLEVTLQPKGCHSVFSEPIRMLPARPPDPPVIDVRVHGLAERKALEGVVCHMILTRDRLCRKLELLNNSVTVMGAKLKEVEVTNTIASLRNIEGELSRGVQAIRDRTGLLSCTVCWDRSHDDGDAVVNGYQVFFDDRPLGKALNADTRSADYQLSSSPVTHVITARSLTCHPIGPSAPSNPVPLCAKDFAPFVVFCYFGVHKKNASWPDVGSCSYQDALDHEIRKHELLKHRGPLGKPLPAPVCTVMDIVTSSWKHLIDSGSNSPVAIMFWTKWCRASLEGLQMFDKFASGHNEKFRFIGCCVCSEEETKGHYDSLKVMLATQGFLGRQSNVRHVCACYPQGQRRAGEADVRRLFGLVGVPTLLICDRSGYMTFQGRVCARDFEDYAQQMLHAFASATPRPAQSLATPYPCPAMECELCRLESEMDVSAILSRSDDSPVKRYRQNKSTGRGTGQDTPDSLEARAESTQRHNIDALHRRLHGTTPVAVLTNITKVKSTPLSPQTSFSPKPLKLRRVPSPCRSCDSLSLHRESSFSSRFSNVMGASLPSLRLDRETPPERGVTEYRPGSSRPKKRISVDEFSIT